MFRSKLLLIIALVYGFTPVLAQKLEKFDVKIKSGFAVHSLPDNELTAIASGKSVLLVNNGGGIVTKELTGSKGIILLTSVVKNGLMYPSKTVLSKKSTHTPAPNSPTSL